MPALENIKNLLWINSNHFARGWEGNYTKGRPVNIEEIVNSYDEIMMKQMQYVINLKDWDDATIKKNTIDNIHFTKAGFQEIYMRIKEKLEET
jgi:hypothetical protein